MESTPAHAATRPAEETDADLLAWMAMAGDDPTCAQAAWETFYRRHVEYLYAVCLRAYGPLLGGEAGAADLVAETFQRAYEHARTFSPGTEGDSDRLRRRTRAWLGRIAERLAQDALRGRGQVRARPLDPAQWERIAAEPRPDDATASAPAREALELARQAIESLTPREQTVIRVTLQWYRPGEPHQRLPNDVCEDLARTLGTTSEHLRQIRRRAMKKIEAFLRDRAPRLGDRSRPR